MSCRYCISDNGKSVFPHYGVGPHVHLHAYNTGSTVIATQTGIEGFTPDDDAPGLGIWWCPHCKEGKPDLGENDDKDSTR